MNWTTIEIDKDIKIECNSEDEDLCAYVTIDYDEKGEPFWVVCVGNKYFSLEKKFNSETKAHDFAKKINK